MRKWSILFCLLALIACVSIFSILFVVYPVFKDMFAEQGIILPSYTILVTSEWLIIQIVSGLITICAITSLVFKKSWSFFWGTLFLGETLIIIAIIIGMYLPATDNFFH